MNEYSYKCYKFYGAQKIIDSHFFTVQLIHNRTVRLVKPI